MIYAASDPADNQLYALKHVVVKNEKDSRFVDQLVNEFEIGSKLPVDPTGSSLYRRESHRRPCSRKATEAAW